MILWYAVTELLGSFLCGFVAFFWLVVSFLNLTLVLQYKTPLLSSELPYPRPNPYGCGASSHTQTTAGAQPLAEQRPGR